MKKQAFILILTLSLFAGKVAGQCNVNVGGAMTPICQGTTSAVLGGSFSLPTVSAVWSDGGAGGTFSNNTGSTPGTATYTAASNSTTPVTLTLTADCGAFGSKTIVVNPSPAANAITGTAALCAGTTGVAYAVTTDNTLAGNTYAWSYSGSNATLSATTGPTINIDFASDATSGTLTVVETITATTCSKTNTKAITVNPTPAITAMTSTVCSGIGFTVTPVDPTNGTVPSGTTYSWLAPLGTGFTGGAAGSGAANINGTLTNPTTSPQTATYATVTPLSGTCPGTDFTVTVTVNPTGEVAQPADQVLCNGSNTTAINFTTSNTGGTTTYSWTNSQPGIGLAALNTGDIASFTAVNSGTAPVVASIIVTPHFLNGSVTCDGPTKTFTITVNPTGEVAQPADQVLCNGSNTTAINFTTSNTGGTTTYSWTNSQPGIGLAALNTGDIASFTAVNSGTAPVVASIIVTPHFLNGSVTCDGPTKTFTITVNPTGEVAQPADQVLCNGSNTTAINFTTSNTGGTTTYSWTNSQPGIGLAALNTGDIASFTAVNSGTAPVVASIIVTPHFLNGSVTCDGPTKTFTITVNPTGEVAQPADQVLCNGSNTTAISFTTSNTGGTTTYSWTNNQPGIGLAALNTGDIASFTAGNSGTAPVVASIIVTPHFLNGSVTCDGPTKTFTITVNPTGEVAQPADQVLCNGSNTTAISFTTSNSGGTTTYSWTNNQPGIGLAASNTGDIASFTAVNSGTAPVVASIIVTPHFLNGSVTCDGPTKTFTITVNPTGQVNQPANQAVCNGTSTTLVTFSTNNTGGTTTYSWINNQTSIGLVGSGTGNISAFTGVNSGTAPVTATITVTPHFTNSSVTCDGPVQTFTIKVNPLPTLTGASQDATICEGSTATINLLGLLPGTTSTVDYTINGGAPLSAISNVSDGSGAAHFSSPSLTWLNDNGKILRVTGITTSSYSPSCTITTFTQDVALSVNAQTIGGSITGPAAVCSGASALLNLSGNTVGSSVVKWQYSTDNWGTVSDIVNTTSTYTATNLTIATKYRAVVQNGVCASVNSGEWEVTINPLPNPHILTGPPPPEVLVKSTGNVYTTEAGMNSYTWVVSAGGNPPTAGAGTDAITVTWNTAGAQTVSINYTDGNGCTAASPTVKNVAVNATPVASNVTILGDPRSGMTLNASYVYSDADGNSEGTSIYHWYTGNDINGTGSSPITSATAKTYKLTDAELGYFIGFSVTPVASGGATPGDKVTTATWVGPVINNLPVATAGAITGSLSVGSTLTGHYTYSDTEGDIESGSTFKWYSSTSSGGPYSFISGETSITHVILSGEQGNYFKFYVIPKALTGNSPGTEVSSAEYGPANTKPSATGVNITGTVAIGNTLTGNYTYYDVNGDAQGTSTFKWFRNGVEISGSTAKTYVIVSTDEAYKLSFQVTPVSATGNPTNGDPVTSSETITVPVSGAIPVVSEVCIDGIRKTGNVIKGKYLFTYNPTTDNSVYRWMRDNDTISGATSITYTLTSADIDHDIYFVVYPYSALPAHKRGVTVKSNSLARIILTQVSYSLADPAFTLVPNVPLGIFSGKGVSNGVFSPLNADTVGSPHNVNYLLNIVNSSTFCSQQANVSIIVVAIKANFVGVDPIYCYDGKHDTITVANLPAPVLPDTAKAYNLKFGSSNPASIVGYIGSNKVIIDPRKMRPKMYKDTIYFSYNYKGSYFPISGPYETDSVGIASINNLHSGDIFCNNDAPFTLFPSLAGSGGVFIGPLTGTNVFTPSKGIGDTSVVFTLTHANSAGCFSTIRVPIRINPSPIVSFKPVAVCVVTSADTIRFNNYTTSADAIKTWLWEFFDAGGSSTNGLKNPGYLYKIGGDHKVTLTATTIHDCSTTKDTTFGIGFKPVTDFYWKNECYHPNDSIMFFDTTSSTATIISRTWKFGVSPVVVKTGLGDVVKNIKYLKNDTGYLSVKYIVKTSYTNCNDSITKSIYIRPTIPLLSTTDYFQNFENGKGGWVKDYSTINSWSFGKPNRAVIKTAASGNKAWYTSFDTLNQKSASYAVISPCFDFTAIQRPMISLQLFNRFDKNRDGAVLQYKVGDTGGWVLVGSVDDGINWFNSTLIKGKPGGDQMIGWTTGTSLDIKWGNANHTLDDLTGKKDVEFRISYGSDGSSQANEGIAFDDIRIGARTRKVLLEHFTNLTSIASSNSNTTVSGLATSMKTDVVNIQYHTNFPGTDAYYNDNPGDASARFLFYGLSRVPYSLIDGGTSINFANIYDYVIAPIDPNDLTRRSMINPSFAITLNTTVSGSIVTINGQIKALGAINAENVTLYLAVTEKKNSSQTGAIGEKNFYNVFRKFIPDAAGISLQKTWALNETYTLTDKTWPIAKIANASDIEVIAFIQNNITKEIYQTESNVKLGIIVGLDNLFTNNGKGFSLYPNPASDMLTIAFENILQAETDVMIYDFKGTIVRTFKTGSGQAEFTINDLGLQNGIYLVRIKSGGLNWGFKKLIISKF